MPCKGNSLKIIYLSMVTWGYPEKNSTSTKRSPAYKGIFADRLSKRIQT